ncbi:16S rRNA (cytosine(967)-C(5))-methyltransferase RsmB [Persicimonas caeni]|uniref:16S rRNA (cytosine(967)-C(5))-methyltransferase RsmB n=1 Tax=Persicimonas caeni TaxID=2292766 RepID=UPI00143DEB1A|nr:16S rRNA (cytosine(967)-C(5))-methyltransferase RsmB [Persicimonas caeni]
MSELNPRQLAQEVLETIEREDAYSHIALDAALERSGLDARDRGLATELVYGTLTWQRSLDKVLGDFVRRGIDGLDLPVLVALRVAVYQLLFLNRIPAHAAVDEAVEITKAGPSRAAAGLVNGVLRSIVRKRGQAKQANQSKQVRWWSDKGRERKPARYLGERYSLPNWMTNRMLQYWGLERAEKLAEAFDTRPPLYLRLLADDVELPEGVEPVEGVPGALRAASMSDAVRAGIADGKWGVQDLGSQLIGLYAGAEPDLAVLDGCAGLGGKTLHLARLVGPTGGVVAVDPADTKIDMLCTAADSAGMRERLTTQVASLQDFAQETDETFDLVLIDAPCSGLGVIRRHPETRWRRSESDIFALTKLQAELLDVAATLVRPGGTLTYSVCTFTTEEGPKQVERFLERHGDFERTGAPESGPGAEVDWKKYVDGDAQLTLDPLEHDTDAFFAARLRRKS